MIVLDSITTQRHVIQFTFPVENNMELNGNECKLTQTEDRQMVS